MKAFKPHQIHTACLAALLAIMASLAADQALAQSNYGKEYSGSASVEDPITGTVSGTNAGIYIHDLSGSNHSLTIGSAGSQTSISSTGSNPFQIGTYDQRQQQSAPSGLLISRSDLTSVTIESGTTISGVNGVTIVRENENYWETAKNTIQSFTNNGTIQATGNFNGFTTSKSSIFSGKAALMVGGAWNAQNSGPAMVINSIQNTGSMISDSGSGIWVGMGGKISAINNTGEISGNYAGIYLDYQNISNGWYYHSEISELTSSGTIKGETYGIMLQAGITKRHAILGSIALSSSGSIVGGNTGLFIGKNSGITKGIQLVGDSDTQGTTQGPTISGGGNGIVINAGSYVNEGISLSGHASINGETGNGIRIAGTVGKIVTNSKEAGSAAIELTNSSTVSGGQFGIYNTGTVQGDIVVDSTSKIVAGTYGLYNEGGVIQGKVDVSGTLTGLFNTGTIQGPVSVTGQQTEDFDLYNASNIKGGLTLNVKGNVSGSNAGTISGALSVTGAKNINLQNSSAIDGKVELSGNQVNFTNTGSFKDSLSIMASGLGTNNSFVNSQTLDMSLTLNISGNLTFTNSGHITSDLSLTRMGTLNFTNSATIDKGFTISGSGAVVLNNQAGGNLQTLTVSGANGLTLQNAGTIAGLLKVSGAGTVDSYQNYMVTNTGNINSGLSGGTFKDISIANTGSNSRLLGDVNVVGTGALNLENAGTRSGATTLSGSGAFTFANTNSWQGDITITGAKGMQLSNTGSMTADSVAVSGDGDFVFSNTNLWHGIVDASGAKAVTIVNQGEFSSGNDASPLLKVTGTEAGDLKFGNDNNWNGNFEISGVNAMTVLNNGTVTAPNSSISGSGDFTFTNTKSWTGDLSVTGAQNVTIDNPGIFSGNLSVTKGTGTAGKVLFNNGGTFKGDATIDFAGNDSVVTNEGLYQGTLTLNGSGTVTIVSKNLWTGAITQIGPNNTLKINEWIVAVTGTDGQYNVVNSVNVTQKDETPLSRSTRSTQNDGIQLDKVIISYADPTKSNVSYSIDLNKVLVVNGGTSDADTIKPTEAVLAPDVQAMGFQGKYYYDEGLYRTTFDTGVTAGAIVSKTMASQLFRRDFFVEAAINESAVGSMYHRRLDGIKGTVFVKPYFSYDTFSEDQVRASGHTQGVMAGMTGFLGRHIVTGIVGYERSQIGTNYLTSDLDLDMQSWYASLMTSHIMFSNRFFDAFGKVTAKASYTQSDITRTLSTLNSEADTKAYSYGANLQMGANIRGIPGGNIIPMIGVGYAMGLTQDYQLDNTGTINDKYIPDNIKLPFADASVTWFQSWNSIVKTFVSAGYRYNLKPTQKTAVQFGANTIHGEFELPKHYQYINSSIVLHMTKDSELAIGYTGVMDETGKSHNLTTKYEIHF